MWMLPRVATVFCALSLISPVSRAQSSNAPGQTELIQQLLQRIDRLERRVAELETTKTAAAPVLAPAPAVVAAGHDHGAPIEPPTSYPSLKISGFTDIDFSASDQKGTRSGFNEGQFILHLSSAL